jgi:hypothetical protein
MGDQAYFGKEKSLSSIFPSQIVDAGSIGLGRFFKEIEE